VVLMPAMAFAQASLTGVVRDASGAVLPGVTVEAASPALIEKVRTTVTNDTGQYRIRKPQAGHLLGVLHAGGLLDGEAGGIELQGSFSATINADMRVGAVEETITVTGESPIVDVQNTTQQRVLSHDVIDVIPRDAATRRWPRSSGRLDRRRDQPGRRWDSRTRCPPS
jgi:hypothetical protein